ncbi:MAG TPA: DUF4194 domain-containing protein [Fibrobacteria bacterium]|nr:DUF4194 domain-containing protein [Fibrobacteria bacterium]
MQTIDRSQNLSLVLITLMKGVTYMETDASLWQALLGLQARVREYLAALGLELILDEAEGYAYLRQKPVREGESELPRLVQRRQLSYPVSLLLALIRKKLAESDAQSGDTRLILGKEEILDMVRTFFADSPNSARLADRVAGNIGKIADMGFLRRLKGGEDRYEVGRILKSFVDAQWLQDFEARLAKYRSHGADIADEERTDG